MFKNMQMKKLILPAILYLCCSNVMAQFNTNLVVTPQPPGSIFNWGTKDMVFGVANATGAARRVVIKATFKTSDGTVVGGTNLARATVITLSGGNQFFYAADVLPADIMVFSGKYKLSLDKTGKLPSDNYQLCVQLVTPIDFLPISEERCRSFNLAAFQLPIPVMPANDMELDAKIAQTAITFRWTPVTPRPVFPVSYRILVFEVLTNQQPVQAMRSNQPLLDKTITGTTQYIWQPQLGMLDYTEGLDSAGAMKAGAGTSRLNVRTQSRQFVWTIQAIDSQGQPFSDGNVNGDGVSEPVVFRVGRKD
jgi:hypothetical protein